MKKLFISFIVMFLPVLAMGQTNQGVVLAEVDFTTLTEFTGWNQFDEGQVGSVELTAEGLAITVGTQTGQLWQPQTMVIPDGSFDLEDNVKYKVVITAKYPTSGTLQINMGSWSSNDQQTFEVTSTGDFQTDEFVFDPWGADIEGCHLLFHNGDFLGTTILKKIQVIELGAGPDIEYNYISKGKIAEVIHKNYKGEVVIPSTVMYEGEEYTVAKIADNAFQNCTKLTSVTIPSSVTSIGSYAFTGCSNLSSVNIPSSVTSINNFTFYNCTKLSSLTIPNSVTTIGNSAFYGCRILSSVTIPNKVTTIGDYAFYGCRGLKTISIPTSITTIAGYAFQGCTGLTSVTIPNSVSSIGGYAFQGCTGLTSVTIPNNVSSIGWSAFQGCTGLTSVTIPNSVSSIGGYAFQGCTGLTSVTIPNSVTTIYDYAFQNCSGLTSLTIGEKVSYINSSSFANCPNLADVYCLAESVPNTNSDAFGGSYIEYATLHVPSASLNSYSTAVPWKNFGSKVAIGGGDIPETQKCAKPTITFNDGKLTFSCATEGVEFISEITAPAMTKKYDNEISLSSTYTVTVFATKVGYINSDKASIVIQANSGIKGDLTEDGKVDVADHVELSNIIMGK